jgi:hypothetical protein
LLLVSLLLSCFALPQKTQAVVPAPNGGYSGFNTAAEKPLAALAERMVREALAKAHWREIDLATQPKGHHVKVKIARQLRGQTPMSRQWIADRLRMGSVSYVSNLLASVDSKL